MSRLLETLIETIQKYESLYPTQSTCPYDPTHFDIDICEDWICITCPMAVKNKKLTLKMLKGDSNDKTN